MVSVRLAVLEEQAAVEAIATADKTVKEFIYLWRRYQNWGPHNPIVACLEDGAPIGFHAATFGSVYANSYYQLTVPAWRGRGVAGQMVEFLLAEAARRGCSRLKFKTPCGSLGEQFWGGFGVPRLGTDGKQNLYDLSLRGVRAASDLRGAAIGQIAESALVRYRRKDVVFDVPVGERMLW